MIEVSRLCYQQEELTDTMSDESSFIEFGLGLIEREKGLPRQIQIRHELNEKVNELTSLLHCHQTYAGSYIMLLAIVM